MLPTKIIITSKHKTQKPFVHKNSIPHKQPNLFFYLKNQLYPAVKQNLISCQMIDGHHHSLQKIIIINENLNIAKFQKVLQFFNGVDIVINTMKELEEYLNIFDYFQDKPIVQYIQAMIEQDIQYYDIFCLLELAYSYGMQRVFDLCLRYLEFDQFQQIKYNKFDFLECNFKLFQIVLRRHHILKMKGQIQGLDVADIEQVIRLYCYRNQIDEQIQHRLIKKYVNYLDKVQKVKTSLRLDKLAHKNILQSANIDSDFYQNQVAMNLHQLKDRPPRPHFPHIKRKYSAEIKKEGLKKMMKFSNNNDDCEEKQQPDAESILQDENQENSNYQINIKVDKNGENQPDMYPNPQNLNKLEKAPYEEPDSIMVSQISGILNQYKEALNIHDQKYRNIRRNAQSTFFNSFRGLDLQPNSKIMKSFNLENPKGLFPIHQPAV